MPLGACGGLWTYGRCAPDETEADDHADQTEKPYPQKRRICASLATSPVCRHEKTYHGTLATRPRSNARTPAHTPPADPAQSLGPAGRTSARSYGLIVGAIHAGRAPSPSMSIRVTTSSCTRIPTLDPNPNPIHPRPSPSRFQPRAALVRHEAPPRTRDHSPFRSHYPRLHTDRPDPFPGESSDRTAPHSGVPTIRVSPFAVRRARRRPSRALR